MASKAVPTDPTGRTVLLERVRLSFTESLKDKKAPANAGPGARETHGCNVIIEADHAEFEAVKALVIGALKAAAKEFKRPENWWKSLWDEDHKQLAFKKGERFKNSQTGEIYDGYAGNLVIAAKGPRGGQKRPRLLDRFKRDVAEDDILDVFYSGCYADVVVSFYGTDNGGTPRLTASFELIRSRQEGERMGGGAPRVELDLLSDLGGDDFTADDDGL